MRTFRSLRWLIYEQGEEVVNTRFAGVLTSEELLRGLKDGTITKPECKPGQELELVYIEQGKQHIICFANKTSDVEEEWFDYGVDSPIIEASIRKSYDYSADYESKRFEKEDEGVNYTQEDYVRDHVTAEGYL